MEISDIIYYGMFALPIAIAGQTVLLLLKGPLRRLSGMPCCLIRAAILALTLTPTAIFSSKEGYRLLPAILALVEVGSIGLHRALLSGALPILAAWTLGTLIAMRRIRMTRNAHNFF
jgi:hypothetical protein